MNRCRWLNEREIRLKSKLKITLWILAGLATFSYHWWSISRKLQAQDKEITEENIYAYILQELEAGR